MSGLFAFVPAIPILYKKIKQYFYKEKKNRLLFKETGKNGKTNYQR